VWPDRLVPDRRQALTLCVLAVAVLLAGCNGVLDDTPDLPDGDEAAERLSSVGVYNETVVVESTFGNETTESRIERTVRPTTGERYQVTRQNGNRTVTVSNGTTTWVYRPAAGEVSRIQTGGINASGRLERIRELVDSLDTDGGAPVAPIVPSLVPGSSTQTGRYNVTSSRFEPVRTEYQGVETVAGRETYVIRMESTETAENMIQQTTYYDTETFVVMRAEYNVTVGDTRVEGQRLVRNISFDPAVEESIFEFDPPDNATITTTDVQQYESYTELEQAVDGHVPDPSVPSGFEFDVGSRTENGLSLQYSNGPAGLFVSRSTAVEIDDSLEQVDDRERTYFVREQNRITTVQWRCGDSVYSVGGDPDRETLLDVADSVTCPAAGN
jgi:outer membrane lipoprotein-sorting protein